MDRYKDQIIEQMEEERKDLGQCLDDSEAFDKRFRW